MSSQIMSPLGSLYLWVLGDTHFAIMSLQIKTKVHFNSIFGVNFNFQSIQQYFLNIRFGNDDL